MNSVVLFENEVDFSTGRAVVEGARALHLLERHGVKEGLTLKAAVLNVGHGQVSVLRVDATQQEVELEVRCEEPILPRVPIRLVVAVSRPQTVKKVLHFASVSGLLGVTFVRTENTQKSYLSSKVLQTDAVTKELLKGVEQSGDCMLPEVQVLTKWHEFVAEMKTRVSSLKVVADTRGDRRLVDMSPSLEKLLGADSAEVVLAFGPESGWSDSERADLIDQDFSCVLLGERQLRVETAVQKLVAQVELLLEQR